MRGKLVSRGKAQRADYILYYKPNMPVVEGRKGRYSFHVIRNRWLTFRADGEEIVDIDFEDQH